MYLFPYAIMRTPEQSAIKWADTHQKQENMKPPVFPVTEISRHILALPAENDTTYTPKGQTEGVAENYLSEWESIPPDGYPPAGADISSSPEENSEQQNKIMGDIHEKIEDILGAEVDVGVGDVFQIFPEDFLDEEITDHNAEILFQYLQEECKKRIHRIANICRLYSHFLNNISDPEMKEEVWNLLQEIILSGEKFDQFFAFLETSQNKDQEEGTDVEGFSEETESPHESFFEKGEEENNSDKKEVTNILPFPKKGKTQETESKKTAIMTENELLKALQDDGKYGLLALASLMMQEEKGRYFENETTKSEIWHERHLCPTEFLDDSARDVQETLENSDTFFFICRNSQGQQVAHTNKEKIMAMIISYLGIEGEINQEHIRNMMMSIAQRSPEAIVHILFHTNPETQTEKAKDDVPALAA